MKIYDCIQFFNEEHIVELRINILNKFVDFFVITESTTDHQGKPKKLNFDLSKFKKYEKKQLFLSIILLVPVISLYKKFNGTVILNIFFFINCII